MNQSNQKTVNQIKRLIKSDNVVKVGLYVGVTVISLYIIGKAFSAIAQAIHGFNDLKSAINGK